ncbi:MAG: STAS domain-containing protein [Gammaproteobacteria bacterium]|nr:STAS domain-containing protein [Gammaproteobacteria bacterium]MCZ6827328.1 STAS domain-containing protein [Gammaproteobacteria bacterium]
MFEIDFGEDGVIIVVGRLDAAEAERAQAFLDEVPEACVLDMEKLEYISSAGLGVLLKTHKRLTATGSGLKMIKVSSHINDIFKYSGFDRLFEIETADG